MDKVFVDRMSSGYGRAGGRTFGFVPLLVPGGSGGTGNGFGTPPLSLLISGLAADSSVIPLTR